MWDWDLLNENKALWLRSPSDVSDEEYLNFYKALAKVSTSWGSPAIAVGCIIHSTCFPTNAFRHSALPSKFFDCDYDCF